MLPVKADADGFEIYTQTNLKYAVLSLLKEHCKTY